MSCRKGKGNKKIKIQYKIIKYLSLVNSYKHKTLIFIFSKDLVHLDISLEK